jgi:DNA ligase 1
VDSKRDAPPPTDGGDAGTRDAIRFGELAAASRQLAGTSSRLKKKGILVDLLARVPPDEVAAAVGWLTGEPLCGPLGVGPAQLWALSKTVERAGPRPTLHDVEEELGRARTAGRSDAIDHVAPLFERLDGPERAFLAGALTGSLRQGSLGGVMVLALAELSKRSESDVRRAAMLVGSVAGAARALLGPQGEQPHAAALVLFRPLAPMLASPAQSLEQALVRVPHARVEWKVDGVRAQIHKESGRIEIYSRQGHAITAGCGPVLDALATVDARDAVLDGEIVLEGPDAAPRPFQETFSAVASKSIPRPGDRLRVYVFDCLYRDGVDLLDAPLSSRLDALDAIVPTGLRMPGLRTDTRESAARFHAEALAAGQEGVVVKDLDSPYRLGARARAWQKVKEFATVDLLVLAAEWGSGRRKGFLSNLHLGARRDDGTFCMVGKTFKGLTDDLLRWQTARFEAIATRRDGHVVHVRPEVVVEIRFNGVQGSPRYPGGVALRFARVVRYREDKPAAEADSLASLVALLPASPSSELAVRKAEERELRKKRQLSLFDP